MSESPEIRLETLAREGRAALDRGELAQALTIFDESVRVAAAASDPDLGRRAECNRAAVAITLGDDSAVARLRQILMATANDEVAFLAAYNVARAYELRKEYRKGLFYGRLAQNRAELAGRQEWKAVGHNMIGNCLAAESHFADAGEAYRQALALMPDPGNASGLAVRANLGYCALVDRAFGDGLRLLYTAAREARRRGLVRLQAITRLDLCYAHLETGRVDLAVRHGERGLALAERMGEVDWIKNGLYLLGEAYVLAGRQEEGYDLFRRLQTTYYPDQGYIPELLLAVDVRQVVNLRA